jgi:hypothetical protein
VETSQHLFKELETAEKLFSDGSIKNAQKIVRNVLKESKTYKKIPNKLKHKINSALSKSRYFDDISSFATNPKRDELITNIDKLIKNPLNDAKKHAHAIHDIQAQWQLLDLSSKPASKSQWLNFNELTNKAWEPCKEYFDEIKEIKINNAKEREVIINEINEFVQSNEKKWPNSKILITYLQKMFQRWQKYAPVLDQDLGKLKKIYFDARKPINDEIRKQENANKDKKEALIIKVNDINHEDNQLNINEFKKLKEEWEKIGPSGKSIERKLWSEFNKNADRFFAEKKQKIKDNIDEIIILNQQLNKGLIPASEVKESLKGFEDIKNTKEYKKIISDIKNEIDKVKLKKQNERINSYKNIINILIKKDSIENAPNIFIKSINKSYESKKSDMEKLQYACVKLEIVSGLDSLKKDKDLRDQIQLELLTNKFNKAESASNDTVSLINYFIENFSNEDSGTVHQNLWKRIAKCIEVIV